MRALFFALALLVTGWGTLASKAESFSTESIRFQSGLMVGVNNPNDYVIQPNWLMWYPARLQHPTQSRGWSFGLTAQNILEGPENLYVGGVFGYRWDFAKRFLGATAFIEPRLGIGWIDSSGEELAQGQNFTFNPAVLVGASYPLGERWSLEVGGIYHHLSNGGLSEPRRRNTGLDSFGGFLGLGIAF
ncbi:MAG: acyloxyacyl hydrolase [Verrucomicrobiales bacterium]